jgi:potassium efflux system protein
LSGHQAFGKWLTGLAVRIEELPSDMGERPMIRRAWFVALFLFSLLVVSGAQAQTAQAPTSPKADAAPQAGTPSDAQTIAPPAKRPAAPFDTAEIVARASKTLGVDIEKRITGWQQELSGLESDLQKPGLSYS